MVNLSDETKETAGSLLSILNSKPAQYQISDNSSDYELLLGIFKLMVKKEEDKRKEDELYDDSNDYRHLQRKKHHEELLDALGFTPAGIPEKKKESNPYAEGVKQFQLERLLKKGKKKSSVGAASDQIKKQAKTSNFLGKTLKFGAIAGVVGAGLFGASAASAKTRGSIANEIAGGDTFNFKDGIKDAIRDIPRPKQFGSESDTERKPDPSMAPHPSNWQPTKLELGAIQPKPQTEAAMKIAKESGYRVTSVVGSTEHSHVPGSQHYEGMALDLTVPRAPKSQDESKENMKKLVQLFAANGIPVTIGDEYYHPIKGYTTGGHYHVSLGKEYDRAKVEAIIGKKTPFLSLMDGAAIGSDIASRSEQLKLSVEELMSDSRTGVTNVVNTFNTKTDPNGRQVNKNEDDDRPIYDRKRMVTQ